jgi:hypothetical protein
MRSRHYPDFAKQLAKFVQELPGMDGADAFDSAAAGI